MKSVKRGGCIVAVGFPTGTINLSIFELVVNGIQLVSASPGTRKDLREALEFAKVHKITCRVEKCKLEDINQILDDMLNFKISGRMVIDFSAN